MADLRLTHLTYAGSGKPTAHVAFGPELTVIYGASDTGKSFIVESIEYMLGGARLPLIPEAEGYSQILLGLRLPDGAPITLVRRPGARTVAVHYEDLRNLVTRRSDRELTAVHRAGSSRSLSAVLLAELGYADARIRKNDAGGTRGLSLSDLVHLSLVTETRMGDPLSPVLRSNAAAGKTAAASLMKYLLTGEDDPLVATGPNAEQRRVHKGQIGLLDQIVVELSTKLTTRENASQLRERLTRIQATIDGQSRSLRVITDRHVGAVSDRMNAAQELAAVESRLAEVHDLITRFGLLEQQYRSDLDRLAMVNEAGSILGYFRVDTCVFCGAEPEHQHHGHGEQETTQLHAAVEAEAAKTSSLLADLLPTIADLRTQLDELVGRRGVLLLRARELDTEISQSEERLTPLRTHMDELLAARSTAERELELHARIEELDDRRSKLDGAGAVRSHRPASHIPARVLSKFDDVLRRTLDAWSVPSVEFAEYDQYGMDVRAGSRPRSGRGQGVRSVLHSAFTTALARYCLGGDLPHPGFVVLDSPVVTYREPVGEDVDITSNVVDHFYQDMLTFPGQAVVIENGDPPSSVLSSATTYRFTGPGGGRPGFFPVSPTGGA
ncbi:hypothetical protein [Kitasatospora purpeofusca]|uniref:hypothetical protein n=1 Tax=Kitasatospora purpeofusca TaxID=67352 RepID=UPI002A59BE65|nr:hypothetical protein [Kitasatospora purpeofusca]MDY0812273.1 hypothetical protein [Kitasatospora purpeofusca]